MSQDIKLIYEPSVYLVGRQSIDDAELSRFLADEGVPDWTTDAPSAAEKIVEACSRLCYHSYARPRPGGNAAHIGHILEVGHGSVTEHAIWTLVVTGVSRSLTHELVRHRVGISPSQLSQRFYDESEAAFVVPPALRPQVRLYMENPSYPEHRSLEPYYLGKRWVDACRRSLADYADLVKDIGDEMLVAAWSAAHAPEQTGLDWEAGPLDHAMKWADVNMGRDARTLIRKRTREAARSVLPNCVETKIALTGNARAFRHVLAMRGDIAADLEFRRLACVLARLFKAEAPNLFSGVEIATADDGREAVKVAHSKV